MVFINDDSSEDNLSGNDFARTDLSGDDFSEANLREADFSKAALRETDFSEANLREADFSGANLFRADLSEAVLFVADFSESILLMADFSRANLSSAKFLKTDLLGVNLSQTYLSRSTQIEIEVADLKQSYKESVVGDFEPTRMWGAIARTYHEIKTAYSGSGLVGRARKYYMGERWARRKEAKVDGGLTGYSTWLASLVSRIVTGYGVQLRWPIGIMLALFLAATAVYWYTGVENSLYYSIVTFTAAPPGLDPPPGLFAKVTAILETFLGTLLIVVLGYVLGAREQV
jgi:hypothetical protein